MNDAQAVINIDGVTRWKRGDIWEDLSLWTPDIFSWFAFHENRWLLTPYSRNVYADAGSEGTYFPAGHYANLAYMGKLPGEKWSDVRPLVVAPFSEYSIFYHRLTIDRKGALFLSYDYWSTFWFYRTDHRGNRRSLLMSPDSGNTWKLASSREFVQ